MVSDTDIISAHLVNYYSEFFSDQDQPNSMDYSIIIIEQVIPSVVTPEDNTELIRIPIPSTANEGWTGPGSQG